jgi:hypothetical protein
MRAVTRQKPWVLWVAAIAMVVGATTPAMGEPSQEEVFKSIQHSVGDSDPISGKTIIGAVAVIVGLVLVGVVVTRRQERQEVVNGGWGSAGAPKTLPGASRGTPGVVNNPAKLVRELMKEAGLTRAQVRQLESLNDRLSADDRAVKNLATLLLCPSLIAAARPEQIVRGA